MSHQILSALLRKLQGTRADEERHKSTQKHLEGGGCRERMEKVQAGMCGIGVWIAPGTLDGGLWMASRAQGTPDEV